MPGGLVIEGVCEIEMEGSREKERKKKPKCTPAVVAQHHAPLRPVIRQR